MNRSTFGLLAVAMSAGFAGQSLAGSATAVIAGFSDPTGAAPVVFEDDTFSLNTTFSDGVQAGDAVFAAFTFPRLGVGPASGNLDSSNIILPGSPDIFTAVADITIEGVVNATVGAVLPGQGPGGTDLIQLSNVFVEVYTLDSFTESLVTDLTGTEANFTDGTLAATFGLDGVDDFYTLVGDAATGTITNFALGLTNLENFTFPAIQESTLTTGQSVDLFGTGDIQAIVTGDNGEFNVGDANFAITLVPSPAAAGVGLLGFFGLMGRRRKAVEQA